MRAIHTEIPDVLILEPKIYTDNRGSFFESFNAAEFFDLSGLSVNFVQDNQSRSLHGVLRGLHYQVEQAQGKLIRCLTGEIFDVAVDLRLSSETFGKWVGVFLSAENNRQMWIPAGFAHGFQVLSASAEVLYKTTEYYAPQFERSILWSDPDLNIPWPIGTPLLSAKDASAESFSSAVKYCAPDKAHE